ncbi:MAG: pitrilysin family protein [Acidobacteriota bacterium]
MDPVKFNRYRLPNDLTVLVSESSRLPLVSISAFVLAGASRNPLQRPGLAALTSRLLDEGTENHSAHEISEMVENTGGSLSTFCEREISGISAVVTSSHLGLSLDLVQEMLRCPVFPDERFQMERQKVLSFLQAMGDDPQFVAANRLNGWVYRNSPLQYPVLGTEQSVTDMDIGDLRCFHRETFAPQNTILVVVGDVQAEQILSMCQERLSDWHNPDWRPYDPPHFERQTESLHDEQVMEKEQITIFLGHLGIRRDNPDYYALQIMDTILGSGPGFTSRIPRTLRDEQGLAYSTYAGISPSSGLEPGRFVAWITTSPENRHQALDGLLFEINDLIQNGITDQELTAAQDYLTGNFVFEFQSNVHVAQFLLAMELYDLGQDYAQRYPETIRKITRQEIHRVARQYLDTVHYATVVVGPKHETKPDNQ